MRRSIALTVALVCLLVLAARPGPAHSQGETDTPTPTDTPTITLTPSITPTPDLYWLTTLEPSGQAGGIFYVVTVGQAAIFAELLFICILLMIGLFLALRRQR